MKEKIIFIIISFFAVSMNLNAACSNEELLKEAKEVSLTSNTLEESKNTYVNIVKIENMKNNQVIVLSEDFFNTKKTYKYNNTKKGVIEITDTHIYSKNTYKIKIYSLDKECKNMLLATKSISTAKFNEYSKYDICDGNEDFEMCKPFYDENIPSKEVFNNALNEYTKEKTNNFWQKALILIKEYYLYVLIPILIITAGYYVYIGIVKWRKRI